MFTNSGCEVTLVKGAPTPQDVGVAFGRMIRLEGATNCWWTYLHFVFGFMESVLYTSKGWPTPFDQVALATQALIWDASQAITYFMPTRTRLTKSGENKIQERIHEAWKVPQPDPETLQVLRLARARVSMAEIREFGVSQLKKEANCSNTQAKIDWTYTKILQSVWNCRYSPDSTARHMAEAAQAYWSFFREYDIEKARHRFGYRTPWISDRYVYPNLPQPKGDHDGEGNKDQEVPERSSHDQQAHARGLRRLGDRRKADG